MPDNQIGLEAVFENEEFQHGVNDYNSAVSDASQNTEESSSRMSGVWNGLAAAGEVAFDAIVTSVAAAATAVTAAVGAITAIVFEAVDAAGELVDLSTKTGISVTSLQELQYVGDQVGTSLDTITSAQARLIRSMDDATQQNAEWDQALKESGKQEDEFDKKVGDMALAFNTLRVSTVDVNGQLRDQEDVFIDVIDALGKIENPVERDALAMQIFGKSAQELNPLIKAGSDELARLAGEAHDVGAVMSEDAVYALESFGDTMASVKAGFKGVLGTLAAQALPAFEKVANALQNLFKSEEFQKRVQEVGRVIGDFVSIVAETVSRWAGIFLDKVPSIIETLKNLGNWFQENQPIIVGILAALGVAIAAFVYTTVIPAAVAMITALAPILAVMALIGAAAALVYVAWTENWGGIQEHVMALWQAIQPILQSLWEWLQVNIPIALAALGEFWTNVLLPAIQAVFSWIVGNLIPLYISLVEWLQDNIPAALSTLSAFWTGTLLPAIQAVWSWIQTNLVPLFNAIAELMNAVLTLAITALAGLWQNVLLPAIQAVGDWISDNLLPIFESLSDTIDNNVMPVLKPFADFLKNVLAKAFEGITNAIQTVIGWVHTLTEALQNIQLPDALTPGSPTPFELGLRGINDQLRRMAKLTLPAVVQEMNVLATVRDVPGANGSTSSAGVFNSSSSVNNYLFGAQFNVNNSNGLIDILTGLS